MEMTNILEDGECVEANDGYIGECPWNCKCPIGVNVLTLNRKGLSATRGNTVDTNSSMNDLKMRVV